MEFEVNSCFLFFTFVGLVVSQSDFMCPANSKMGLCDPVPNPCFGDEDCLNGDICCPHACSRVCKAKIPRDHGPRPAISSSLPDLLNDPRVYVGQCPEASCVNMFGGDANQCDTSKLCPQEQFCCHDGCKNVCLVKPEYAALLAEREAKMRQHQQVMYQKHQEMLRMRQQEYYMQQQRQIAAAEQARRQAEAAAEQARRQAEMAAYQARRQAEARAEAEKELAAQQARSKYEAELKVKAEAVAKATSKMQQQLAQQQAAALLQQQQLEQQQKQQQLKPEPQSSSQTVASKPSAPNSGGSTFLDNFVDAPQSVAGAQTYGSSSTQLIQQTKTPFQDSLSNVYNQGFSNEVKRDNLAGSMLNQVNSPANYNPYNFAPQQSAQSKSDAYDISYLQQTPEAQYRLASLISPQPGHAQSVTKGGNLYSQISPNYPSSNTRYQRQRSAVPESVRQQQTVEPAPARPHQAMEPAPAGPQQAMEPYLMYHFMQYAA